MRQSDRERGYRTGFGYLIQLPVECLRDRRPLQVYYLLSRTDSLSVVVVGLVVSVSLCLCVSLSLTGIRRNS